MKKSQRASKSVSRNEAKNGEKKESKEMALHYMKTLVDVARESFIILDADLRVISANPTFYSVFQVKPRETENKLLYELGNGQWNIPEFKKLLQGILPKEKVVRDYEVTHAFEVIGEKTILLNARQIDSVQLIIIAMEDVTVKKDLEKEVAVYTKELEDKVRARTAELDRKIRELETLNKSMVGRELKMVELKKEIGALRGDPRSPKANKKT